jgi:hypothetical protein
MTFSRRVLHPFTTAILAMACFGVQAASHREAPLIAQDPTADITDVYAFVSYDEENLKRAPENRRVTLIMNVIPGQNPADGPNYFYFADDVVYRLHVDNNMNGKAEDVVYEFRFNTETRPVPLGGGTLDLPLALVAIPPITALDGTGSEGIYRRQTFSVTEVRNDAKYKLFPGQKLVAVPSNLGSRTIPDYDALAGQGIYSGACGDGTDGVRVYAGQRAETFYIDLGATFDTLNFRRNLPLLTAAEDANDSANPFGINRFGNANINTIAIELPIKCLTKDRKPVLSPNAKNALIGVYASTSRPKVRVLRDRGDPINVGADVQIARLANPLVNELIINTPSKDFWNLQEPKDEAQFQDFYRMPVIAAALQLVFGVPVPATPRSDLLSVLLKYPGQPLSGTNCGSPCSELLRLNLGVAPVVAEKQRRLGPFAHDDQNNATPDPAGWPNGRRPNDDVTDIAVRVVGGANYINALAGDGVNAFLEAPGIGTNDGPGYGKDAGNRLDVTANGIAKEFPFLPTPFSGRN